MDLNPLKKANTSKVRQIRRKGSLEAAKHLPERRTSFTNHFMKFTKKN